MHQLQDLSEKNVAYGEALTRRYGYEYDRPHTLVESSEENLAIDGILGCVKVYFLVVGTLKSCFQSIKGIDELLCIVRSGQKLIHALLTRSTVNAAKPPACDRTVSDFPHD